MNATRWRPRSGKPWNSGTLWDLIHRDFYAGYVEYAEVRQKSNLVPPIWDEETYRAVVRERERRHVGGKQPRSPCSSFVVCGQCGGKMTLTSLQGGGRRYFRCGLRAREGANKCHANYVAMQSVEQAVELAVTAVEDVGAALAEAPDMSEIQRQFEAAQKAAQETREALTRLNVAQARGDISAQEHHDARAVLVEELEAAVTQAQGYKRQLDAVPSLEERRRAIEELRRTAGEGNWLRELSIPEARALLAVTGLRVVCECGRIVGIHFGLD